MIGQVRLLVGYKREWTQPAGQGLAEAYWKAIYTFQRVYKDLFQEGLGTLMDTVQNAYKLKLEEELDCLGNHRTSPIYRVGCPHCCCPQK